MKRVFISLFAVVLLIPVIFTTSGCQTSLESQISDLREELARLESEISGLREELSDKQGIIDSLQSEVDDKSSEIDRLLADIAEKSTRIEELETELAELQKPAEEKVTPRVFGVDYHHSHAWGIRFEDYAEGEGWKVIKIDVEPLTFEYLEQQDVSILGIPALNLSYTAEEVQEIVKFVENGGGLLLIAGYVPSYSDSVAMEFGVRIVPANLESNKQTMVLPYHPLGKDVDALQLDGRSYLLTVSPPAYLILQEYNKPVMAAGEFGAGRFVVCPEVFDLDAADNAQFMHNVLHWLEQIDF